MTGYISHRVRRPSTASGACLSVMALAWLASCAAVSAEDVVLENPALRVELRSDTGRFDVLDRRCGHWWRQDAAPLPPAPVAWTIRERTGAVVVDGQLDEWPDGPAIAIDHSMTADDKDIRDDADSSARVRFLWDKDALYMAAEVRDDKPAVESKLPGEWESDCVELWIGSQHLGFFRRGGRDVVVCWTNRALAERCRSAAQVTENGWRVEARIPLGDLPGLSERLRQGGAIELAVGVDDADDPQDPKGRQSQIFAPPGYKHSRVETFALASLADGQGRATGPAPAPQRDGFTGKTVEREPADRSCVVQGTWLPKGRAAVPMAIRYALAENAPDLFITIEAPADSVPGDVIYPEAFAADPPDGRLLVPQDEGYMVPVTAKGYDRWLTANPSMPWFGVTHLKRGHGFIAIFETPDDVAIRGRNAHGHLGAAPLWRPSMRVFGGARRVLYSFCDTGRYVSLAKRYRHYARRHGFLRTFAEKAKENGNVKRLPGVVDIYGHHGVPFLEFLHRLGIDRAIIHGGKGEVLDETNRRGYVSSRYDIYTDLYDPATPRGKWERCRFYSFPADCIKKKDGSLRWGWCHQKDKDGKVVYPSYLACTSRRIWNMKKKIPADLEENHYLARFLDCETAAGLHECHDPAHRMTRGDDRRLRAKAFEYVWSLGLMVGSERGKWWGVPWACYYEGIQSTGSFKDTGISGWPIDRPAHTTPKYLYTELSPEHRLPLFELVYHDCVLTTWWWGDQNHRIPEVWARKDLIQVLYGTMPLWFLSTRNMPFFYRNRDRFRLCYDHVCRWHRAVAFDEMTDHRHLSDDLALQESRFASGLRVVANLGEKPQALPDGRVLPGYHYLLDGPPPEGVSLPLGKPIDPGIGWTPAGTAKTLNPDFELGLWGWRAAKGMELTEATKQPHSGKVSARLHGTSQTGYSYASGLSVPVREGERWRLSGWMRVDAISNTAARPSFKFCLLADKKYVTNIFTPQYDTTRLGTWQKLEVAFPIPTGKGVTTGHVAVEKRTTESAQADLAIDGILCERLSRAANERP